MSNSTTTEIERRRLAALDANEFKQLLELDGGEPVSTLLLPMERKGPETRKNPIVFKNALAAARDELQIYGGRGRFDALGERLEALEIPPDNFWQTQDEGLAMVIGETGPLRAYQTPFPLGPFTSFGHRPYLAPLLRLTGAEAAYVLVLDLSELRLFRARLRELEEIPLERVPRSLEEAMQFDDPEKSLQSRRVTATNKPGPGGGNVAFHGHGITGDEAQRKRVQRFFERVDKDLASHFENQEMPLILIGPDAEVALYREVNHYPHCVQEDICLNAGNLSEDELRTTIAEAMLARETALVEDELELLNGRIEQGQGSLDLREIGKAAVNGRIATLFVRAGEYRYGVVRRHEDRVEIHDERQAGDQELIGAAATEVALTGGEVRYLEERSLPENSPAAAVFRY